MTTYRNIGGTWKSGTWWRNIGGTWKQTNTWRKIAGTWKNLSVVFNPDGGSTYASGQYNASQTLTCNVPAVWTYSTVQGNGGTVSVANGGTSTSITFNETATGGSPGNRQGRSQQWSVTAMANGVTKNFDVTVEAFGDNI